MKNKNIFGYLFFGFFMLSILYFGGHVAYYLIQKYHPDLIVCLIIGLTVYLVAFVAFWIICGLTAGNEDDYKE